MSSLHFPRQHRSGASSGRLSFTALFALTLVSAATGAVVALIAQRIIQNQRTIDVLPSPTPIRYLRDRAFKAEPAASQTSLEPPAVGSSLGVVATKLSASRTAELEQLVARDVDVVAGDGSLHCPAEFPIKGNGRSGIYHWPGAHNYQQTHPTLCFRTTDAADNAGFRRATR